MEVAGLGASHYLSLIVVVVNSNIVGPGWQARAEFSLLYTC